jgi:hypothetical protein
MKLLQTKKTTLSYGINDSATTMRLVNLLKLDGSSIVASDLDTILYGTFAPGTSREEIFLISGSNMTFNVDGTVDITNVSRGLKEVYPYTTGGYACDHGAGEIVVFGNNPQVYEYLKLYIDAAVAAGGVPATDTNPGISTEATQAQVDAKTAQETFAGTPYDLFVRPDTLRATKYHDYIADVGATDDYAITTVPAISAYADGQEFTFLAPTANTGACTLNVSGKGAIAIKKNVTLDLETGDIIVGQVVKVVYKNAVFQMVSPHKAKHSAFNVTSSSVTSASFPMNIAHGLGVIPKRYNFMIMTTNGAISVCFDSSLGGRLGDSSIPAAGIMLSGATSANYYEIVIGTIDATNIQLTYVAGAGSVSAHNMFITGSCSNE